MACESCGEHPKNTAKDFTKAVIEINNPETLILFRKVIIPASMGDETDTPAAIGKYHNVLLVYEANNHAYLYSSDGIPTLLVSDVAQEIERRVEDLEEADVSLQNQINLKANTADLSTVATSGNYADLTNTPTIGNATLTVQCNSTNVGTFTANSTSNTTIDISVPTSPADIGAQPLIDSSAKISADLVDDTSSTNKFVTAADLSAISTAVQPADINKIVMTDLAVDPTVSTSTVQLDTTKENLSTGSSTAGTLVLPVASSTQAGIINSSTYDTIAENSSDLNAIMNGAVAVTGLAASPSQSDITSAWMTETGLSTLINRASVYDVDNDKVWTYYTNDTTWHAASNTTQVTVNTFTNSSEGTIKGSTNTGQIFAESDGTGSVNGWDALNNAVSGKQDTLTPGTNIAINGTTISATDTTYSNFVGATSGAAGSSGLVPAPASGETGKYLKSDGTWGTVSAPTVNDATLTIQKNGSNVATFTANSSTNVTADITVPVITMQTTDPGEGSTLAANNYIGVYGGDPIILDYSTTEKNTGTKWINGSDIYKKTVSVGTLPSSASTKSVSHGISNISKIIKIEGYTSNTSQTLPLPYVSQTSASDSIAVFANQTNISVGVGASKSSYTETYVTLYYTKSS